MRDQFFVESCFQGTVKGLKLLFVLFEVPYVKLFKEALGVSVERILVESGTLVNAHNERASSQNHKKDVLFGRNLENSVIKECDGKIIYHGSVPAQLHKEVQCAWVLDYHLYNSNIAYVDSSGIDRKEI